jgi:predicted transcriptional regulator
VGKKGDRAAKEGLAKDLYAQGKTLDEIASLLDSTATSLSRWKSATKAPSAKYDEWELARQRHRDFIEELRALFREQLEYIRSLPAKERTSQDYDALSKAAAIVRKWDDIERAEAAKQMAEVAPVDLDKPALFLEFLEWLALNLKETDPEGLKILARNFDSLVIQFKTEHAQAA